MKKSTQLQTGLVLLTTVLLASPSLAADRIKLKMPNGTKGTMRTAEQVKQDKLGSRGDTTNATRVSGSLRYSPSVGLKIGTRVINITPNTTIYPTPAASKMPSHHELHGKVMTVFGKTQPDGSITAVLMISGDKNTGATHLGAAPKAPTGFIPSEVEPLVGEISEDVHR